MFRSILSQFSSIVMALLFAGIIWVVATSEQNPSREAVYPDPLPIELANRVQGTLVFQKTADTVRVKLRAPQVSWDQLQPTSFRVSADLGNYGTGLHQIPITVQVTDPRVIVLSVEPAAVGVRIEELKSRDFDIHGEVMDTPPLGFVYRLPTLTPSQVTVSGPAVLVEQVVQVSAEIFLRGSKSPVERDVTLTPRDAQGSLVQGVAVVPSATTVRVQVEQRVGYKDVSIKAALKGNVAAGFWISNIAVVPSNVTVAGSPDALAKLAGFVETIPIDVTGATTEVTKRVAISLPEGVSILNNEGVMIQVAITPILGGQTIRRKIDLQGLKRGATGTVSPDVVDVILSGPMPSLGALTPNDVQVVIDVTSLGAGVYQLKPRVPVVPETLKIQSIVPDTLQVNITEPLTTTIPITPTVR